MTDRSLPPLSASPRISVVVPCRNELPYIGACLQSIVDADRSNMALTVLVCDGMSDDGTREVIGRFAREHAFIRLVENELRTTPIAMNLGLRAQPFEIGQILGAHATVAPDHFQRAVSALRGDRRAGCAGGAIRNIHTSDSARRIGLAMGHPFGVGSAHFRTGTRSGYVDTVAFGAYRAEVFEAVGWFDEDLDRNQDDEFNHRMTKAGFKILLDPTIRSNYVVRGSFDRLWRQYEQYGMWKVFVNRKHRAVTTLRQVVPAAWVAFLVVGCITALFFPVARWIFLAGASAYFFLALRSAFQTGAARDVPGVLRAFFTLHLAYGVGYWMGIVRAFLLRQRPGARARSLTR